EFRFFASSLRKDDSAGTLIEEVGSDLEEIAPVKTTLDGPAGTQVPVTIESKVTEVGTLELWCVARDGRRWKLEYGLREPSERSWGGPPASPGGAAPKDEAREAGRR